MSSIITALQRERREDKRIFALQHERTGAGVTRGESYLGAAKHVGLVGCFDYNADAAGFQFYRRRWVPGSFSGIAASNTLKKKKIDIIAMVMQYHSFSNWKLDTVPYHCNSTTHLNRLSSLLEPSERHLQSKQTLVGLVRHRLGHAVKGF